MLREPEKTLGVKGYNIGGKTGTSEDGVNTNKYVTSFIGVATISDPKVVILVTLYNPTGEGGHQGGAVGAPVASQVLSEVLPYLELSQDNSEDVGVVESVSVPDIRNMTVSDAKKTLKEIGLEIIIDTEEEINEKEYIITEQIPKPGIMINSGSNVICKIGTN